MGSYYRLSQHYMVSNYGRVFNIDRFTVVQQYQVDHGYLQVTLAIHEKKWCVLVHRLVCFIWNDNDKGKTEVHHIDGNKKNNRADNLLWVTETEHNELHKLMDEAKRTGDYSKYYKRINEIKADNKTQNPYYCILDYIDDTSIGFLTVTEKAFHDLKKGKYDTSNIPFSEIRGEFVAQNETGLKTLEKDSPT